jgi:hypothetical protein
MQARLPQQAISQTVFTRELIGPLNAIQRPAQPGMTGSKIPSIGTVAEQRAPDGSLYEWIREFRPFADNRIRVEPILPSPLRNPRADPAVGLRELPPQ